MTSYKSLDYLQEIKNDNLMSNNDLITALENIGYLLSDNGYHDARFFLDDIIDKIEENEINVD